MRLKKKYGSMYEIWKSHFAYVYEEEIETINAVDLAIKNSKDEGDLCEKVWVIMEAGHEQYSWDVIEEFLNHLCEKYIKF